MIFGVDLVFNLSQLIRQYVNPKRVENGSFGSNGSKAHWLDLRSLWKVNALDCKLGMIKRKKGSFINPLKLLSDHEFLICSKPGNYDLLLLQL